MHSTQEVSLKSPSEFGLVPAQTGTSAAPNNLSVSLGDYKVIRRNGAVVGFEPSKTKNCKNTGRREIRCRRSLAG